MSNNNPSTRKTRRMEEQELYAPFLEIALKTGGRLLSEAREKRQIARSQQTVAAAGGGGGGVSNNNSNSKVATARANEQGSVVLLTPTEESVFGKYSYYGWGIGAAVGLATFGVLGGGLLWSHARRLHAGTLPTRRTVQAAEALLHHQTNTLPPPTGTKSSLADVLVSDVRFVFAGAFSTVLTVLVASANFDKLGFYQKLATVPLHPGKSYLCARMCPELRHEEQRIPPSRRFLWQDPETEELEAVVRLVQNCQQRMNYETKLRREQNISHGEPVEVPDPGVPLQYDYNYEQGGGEGGEESL